MKNKRIDDLVCLIKQFKLDYLLIQDPVSIDYLIDEMIYPGERFLGLLLDKKGNKYLILNKLFYLSKNLDLEILWYFDTDDIIEIISKKISNNGVFGVDKMMPAKWLLPLKNILNKMTFVNGSINIDTLRMIKDAQEIDLMRKASKINDQAISELIASINSEVTEMELAHQLEEVYKKYGGEGLSFEPIIAYGRNGADGHHRPSQNKLQAGDSIVIDMGCYYQGYCSDMTRTVFYKTISKEAKIAYELVKKANESAIAMIKPGVKLSDIDYCARNIITEAGYGEFFNHRLGHFIGKEVHEYGDVSSQFDLKVEEGMIFSIEPGIYIKNQFGIRIEDLVLVTKDGCEVLNNYPKDLMVLT
jgi:Xaa-Pro aminopeptidase